MNKLKTRFDREKARRSFPYSVNCMHTFVLKLAVGATASLPAMTEEAEAQDEELIIENETDGADSLKGTSMCVALTLAFLVMNT